MKKNGFTPLEVNGVWQEHKESKPLTGFTLLELLVVIAIIGILSSALVVNSIQGAARARDARRVQELYQIANALLQYYSINEEYPDNTDSGDIGCWSNWDAGNIVNGEGDPFIKPLVDEGFLTFLPREWKDVRDPHNNSQCTYRYQRMTDPCGGDCEGTYAILYAACETKYCPINERPNCCTLSSSGDGEEPGIHDRRDIAIFLKEPAP